MYKTSVDVITTSEVAVSITIDKTDSLDSILTDLRKLGTVEVENKQSIVCVVGNILADKTGIVSKIFNALSDIPVRMISYGGSNYNVTLLVHTEDKINALKALNTNLFGHEEK
jgi:aspartate kinase